MAAPTEKGGYDGEVRKVAVPYGRASMTSAYYMWNADTEEWVEPDFDLFTNGKNETEFKEI